jgi:hypothetical protein
VSGDIVINSNTYRRNGFGEWADDHGYIIYGGFSDCLDEIERLRAAGDAMAEALDALCYSYCGNEDDADLVDAWQEARRASMTGGERYFAAGLANPEYRQAYEDVVSGDVVIDEPTFFTCEICSGHGFVVMPEHHPECDSIECEQHGCPIAVQHPCTSCSTYMSDNKNFGTSWRWRIFSGVDRLCALTGHRWCPVLVTPFFIWADKHEQRRREQ